MRKHRKLLLASLMTAALGGVLLSPPVYWRLVGTLRGEAFWKGRPTSYYRSHVRACGDFSFDSADGRQLSWRCAYCRREPWHSRCVSWVCRYLGDDVARRIWPRIERPFGKCDPGAVPVLTELVSDPDDNVLIATCWALRDLGRRAEVALPAVRARMATCDPDTPLRGFLQYTAEMIELRPRR